ncbi:MAG: hypothetical protein FJX89_03875 [Bacteroidetes bacterium]|nr:hypothetical protein [Bacteroidota bacterium]
MSNEGTESKSYLPLMMEELSRSWTAGMVVLVGAIACNLLVQGWRVMGWYEFLSALSREGSPVFSRLRWVDAAWLFVLYPLLLGLFARAGLWLSARILG